MTKSERRTTPEAGTPITVRAAKLGQHASRPREAVLAVLAEQSDFTSAQTLYYRMSAQGQRVGLATVYRALHALEDAGLVDTVKDSGGQALFRARQGTEHRHYLRCRACGYNLPVTSPVLEHWAQTTAEGLGFTHVEHVLELTGVCNRCEPLHE